MKHIAMKKIKYLLKNCFYMLAVYGVILAMAAFSLSSCNNPSSAEEKQTHQYVITDSQAATCTEDGYNTYTCSQCGDSYTETIDKLGHDWEEEWTIDIKPTISSEGEKSHHCSRCNERKDVTVVDKVVSEGMYYELNDTKDGYIVIGIGSCTDTEIVISDTHLGLPVVAIGEELFSGNTKLDKCCQADN